MKRPGFFGLSRRYESLDAKADPLAALNKLIPWEDFRLALRAALEAAGQRTKPKTRKGPAGRKPLARALLRTERRSALLRRLVPGAATSAQD